MIELVSPVFGAEEKVETSIGNAENFARDDGNTCESEDVSQWSKKGYQLLKENRIDDACGCFNKILDIDDNNNYALVGLGDASRKKGYYRDAVDFYCRCLDHHPGNNYALFGLADCYKILNQYNKAIEIWEQYLVHDDRNITVLTRVADAYRKVKKFKHSRDVYLKVLEMEKTNPYAIIGLGHLYYDFKEYREALHYWEIMFENSGDTVDIRVLTSIGNCHRKLKTFTEGIPFFEKAIKRDPSNFYALFGLADCYRGLNQPDRSLEYWNHILEQDPRNKMILTRAGDAYRSLNDYENACEYYKRALNIEFDTYAVLGLAVVSKVQNKYDEAIASLKRLIQQDPKNYRFYMELSDCQARRGDKHGAVEALNEFQKHGMRNTKIIEMLDKYSN